MNVQNVHNFKSIFSHALVHVYIKYEISYYKYIVLYQSAFIMLIQNTHAIFIDNIGGVYEMGFGYMRWIICCTVCSLDKIHIKTSTKNFTFIIYVVEEKIFM